MSEKAAIVTGAGRGIGRAVAARMARDGYNLTLAGRTAGSLNAAARDARRHKVKVLVAPTDVRVAAEVQALVDATVEAFGRIDLLVNSAAVAINQAQIEQFSEADFDATFDTNVKGIFLTTRAVWPVMKGQADGGVIVNISSLSARNPFAGLAVYGASKAAVNLMTASLARIGRQHNIRLYAVGLGAVETDMLRGLFPDFPDEKVLRPEEVADLVARCTDPALRHCSGEPLWISKQ